MGHLPTIFDNKPKQLTKIKMLQSLDFIIAINFG
jgi:hypothetical protein